MMIHIIACVWVCGCVGVWVCGCVGVWVCVCVCVGVCVCGCVCVCVSYPRGMYTLACVCTNTHIHKQLPTVGRARVRGEN